MKYSFQSLIKECKKINNTNNLQEKLKMKRLIISFIVNRNLEQKINFEIKKQKLKTKIFEYEKILEFLEKDKNISLNYYKKKIFKLENNLEIDTLLQKITDEYKILNNNSIFINSIITKKNLYLKKLSINENKFDKLTNIYKLNINEEKEHHIILKKKLNESNKSKNKKMDLYRNEIYYKKIKIIIDNIYSKCLKFINTEKNIQQKNYDKEIDELKKNRKKIRNEDELELIDSQIFLLEEDTK